MSSMEGSDQLDLPGFRFHPTEEELLDFYLKKAVNRENLNINIIGTLNLYRFNPWDLPQKAKIGEREWYFLVPRDRRHNNGGRLNRTTEKGFWKATGSDRHVRSVADPKRVIGLKKTLVFYQGRAPRGTKTDWVMNEYRLPDDAVSSTMQEDIVLCKVYRKATSMKELEQRAALAEHAKSSYSSQWLGTSMTNESISSSSDHDQEKFLVPPMASSATLALQEEEVKQVKVEVEASSTCSSIGEVRPMRNTVPELELEVPKASFDWNMQDPFLTQLRSPWIEYWSPYANLLNF